MEWMDSKNKDKKVLYVHGKYGNQLNIQVKVLFVKARLPKDPTDPQVLAKANHPITESGFGQSLVNIRKLSTMMHGQGKLKVTYGGRGQPGPDGQPCFKVVREFSGYDKITKATIHFDERTLMPVQIETYDREGFKERYTYRRVVLNPKLPNGTDELTVHDFYRSAVFPDDRDWGKEHERWTFEDVAREYCKNQQTIRFP
jgi:hypothetical protein